MCFHEMTACASEIDSFLYKRSSLDVFQLWIDLGLAKSAGTRPRVHGSKVQRDTEPGSVAGSGAQPLLDNIRKLPVPFNLRYKISNMY